MPRPPGNNARAVKIDAGLAGIEKSLPLEGGAPRSESKIYMTAGGSHTSTTLVRLKPDRMRSKVTASYQPMVKIDSFDLISQPLRAASFSSRRSLDTEVRDRLLRVKPSPAYRGWHGASRDGCGGDPVRIPEPPKKMIDPTSVTP